MAPREHFSLFSYNIERPYPFRWFTPAAGVGFVLFTTLFSFLNFGSTGFYLVVQSSSNPNATIAENVWLRHWPSFTSHNVQPTCQAVNLPINSQFFTNHTALTYTLTSVWQQEGRNVTFLPSLTYFNNVLENCVITSIEIDVEAMDRSANQIAYSEWGETIRSYITCSIQNFNSTTLFNLTQKYNYVPADVTFEDIGQFVGSNFLERNKTSKASLWWGESLMSTYWAVVSGAMQTIRKNQTENGQAGIRKGTLPFTRDYDATADITSNSFFRVDFRFIVDRGLGNFAVIHPGTYNYNSSLSGGIATLMLQEAYPNIWMYMDRLAKSAYSTILLDLGQNSTSPNILTNATALQFYTELFSDLPFIANAHPGPATEEYSTLKTATGQLGTTPSVISTEYLCQVPQRKAAGTLFISVLVADLVLLQALWRLFKLGTEYIFLRKIPKVQYCEGCGAQDGIVPRWHDHLRQGADTLAESSDDVALSTLEPSVRLRGARGRQRSVSEQSLLEEDSIHSRAPHSS